MTTGTWKPCVCKRLVPRGQCPALLVCIQQAKQKADDFTQGFTQEEERHLRGLYHHQGPKDMARTQRRWHLEMGPEGTCGFGKGKRMMTEWGLPGGNLVALSFHFRSPWRARCWPNPSKRQRGMESGKCKCRDGVAWSLEQAGGPTEHPSSPGTVGHPLWHTIFIHGPE